MRRPSTVLRPLLVVGLVAALGTPLAAQARFRRGNANGDFAVDISDAVFSLSHLFLGGLAPPCPDGADANDDGDFDLGDPIFTLNFLFRGGPTPPAPGPAACGVDPTADTLGPCREPGCVAGACIDLTFSTLPAPPPGVAANIAVAASLRMLAPDFAYLAGRLAADASSSEAIVILESFHRESEALSFVYFRIPDGGTRLQAAANIDVVMRPFGPAVSTPGPIMELDVPLTAALRARVLSIASAGASPGGGGDPGVEDGMVHFLSVDAGATCIQHALHGYDFRVHGAPSTLYLPVVVVDGARYAQDAAVYDLWVDLFGPPGLAPLVAEGDSGMDDDGAAAGAPGGIVINGSPEFKQATLQALMAISPCYIYELANCRVILSSPADFAGFCRCYCQHLAGTNLICDLGLSSSTTTITDTAGGNSHSNGTVKWNPAGTQGGRNADGNRDRPPKVGLAHELIHAKHTHCGTRGTGSTGGIPNEEINCCRGENQIRGECGQPARTHYGDNPIPDNTDSDLDDSNRVDCPK